MVMCLISASLVLAIAYAVTNWMCIVGINLLILTGIIIYIVLRLYKSIFFCFCVSEFYFFCFCDNLIWSLFSSAHCYKKYDCDETRYKLTRYN